MNQARNNPESAKIFVGTPAYNCQVHTAYVHSVLDFSTAGLNVFVFTLGNESLITRARNTIISTFWNQEEFSHLLFLDADVGLNAGSLKRLLSSGRDVIGATVPLKGYTEQGRRRYNMGKIIGRNGVIASTRWLGTAVLLLSRKAVEALIRDAVDAGRVYRYRSRLDGEATEYYDVFQVGVVDGKYLSEDFWVCHRLRRLGYDINVHLAVKPDHHGMHRF